MLVNTVGPPQQARILVNELIPLGDREQYMTTAQKKRMRQGQNVAFAWNGSYVSSSCCVRYIVELQAHVFTRHVCFLFLDYVLNMRIVVVMPKQIQQSASDNALSLAAGDEWNESDARKAWCLYVAPLYFERFPPRTVAYNARSFQVWDVYCEQFKTAKRDDNKARCAFARKAWEASQRKSRPGGVLLHREVLGDPGPHRWKLTYAIKAQGARELAQHQQKAQAGKGPYLEALLSSGRSYNRVRKLMRSDQKLPFRSTLPSFEPIEHVRVKRKALYWSQEHRNVDFVYSAKGQYRLWLGNGDPPAEERQIVKDKSSDSEIICAVYRFPLAFARAVNTLFPLPLDAASQERWDQSHVNHNPWCLIGWSADGYPLHKGSRTTAMLRLYHPVLFPFGMSVDVCELIGGEGVLKKMMPIMIEYLAEVQRTECVVRNVAFRFKLLFMAGDNSWIDKLMGVSQNRCPRDLSHRSSWVSVCWPPCPHFFSPHFCLRTDSVFVCVCVCVCVCGFGISLLTVTG